MSGRYNGAYMRAYKILPTQKIKAASLSPAAQQRLWWLDWYTSHGRNAAMTCRHFGISKSVFYRWKARFNPTHLVTLEDDKKTRKPHRLRTMTTPHWVIQKVIDIRFADIEKSKYEIQEELRRQGIAVGQSTIQKVINRNPMLINQQYRKKYRAHKRRTIARLKASLEMKEKAPGSLVQVDTKYFYVLGKKYYLFTAIDCKTRYGFLWCYQTISSASAADFVRKVREYFPFPIAAINTDNGSEYLLHFH